MAEEHQNFRPYIDNLTSNITYLSTTEDNLGPRGQYLFPKLRSVQVIRLLQDWRNGRLPDNHVIKNLPVYSFLPDLLYDWYGLSRDDRRPLWYLTHLFKKAKFGDDGNRMVLCDGVEAHWVPGKNEVIRHRGGIIGNKLSLALWAKNHRGKCVRTEFRMVEFTLNENPDPAPSASEGKMTEEIAGLYKHKDWMISKIYRIKTKRHFSFYRGTFEVVSHDACSGDEIRKMHKTLEMSNVVDKED